MWTVLSQRPIFTLSTGQAIRERGPWGKVSEVMTDATFGGGGGVGGSDGELSSENNQNTGNDTGMCPHI